MANRHFTFDHLSSLEIGIPQRASGTLGRHHFIIVDANPDNIYVSGFDSDGSKTKEIVVKKGGAMGYNRGDLWAIKPQNEMSPLQRLRSTFKLSREQVQVLPRTEIENVEIVELSSSISPDSPHANHNRFWGNGETECYVGKFGVAFWRHSFHGGVDQRREIGRVFLDAGNLNKAVEEAFTELSSATGRPYSNIKHPANGLFFETMNV
jgi:hypothetical protein